MKIIIGHANMDLDCLGSMALARYLYPNHKMVQSTRLHPTVKNLYNLYRNHLNMLQVKDLKEHEISSVIMVDTSSRKRVAEYFRYQREDPEEIIIYDHHQEDHQDYNQAIYKTDSTGSNTTLLALECREQGILIDERDATIALTGIYADTGHFRHTSVTHQDFAAASWCMSQGASLNLVNKFVRPLKEQHQVDLFHLLMGSLNYGEINGQIIITTYNELEKQVGGLAAVVEKIYEVESADAIFSFFYFREENETLVVARSRDESMEVNSILSDFGGGGHSAAASALIKDQDGSVVLDAVMEHLHNRLAPAVLAQDIMTRNVKTISQDWKLMEASMFLEKIGHTGGPVVDDSGTITGFLTLRDIMKGRKGDNMNAPVYTYMKKNVVTCLPDTTLREIERLMFTHNIGHLPVMVDDKLEGIVTRSDYLKWYR